LSQGKSVSSKDKCESFGEGGDGYIPGEGVGAVLLKSTRKAQADGDHIYAVIKGTALNHGGKTNGYMVPNLLAQAEVIKKALIDARVDARTISYIEAHGTGTTLGDPIEISGLSKAFANFTAPGSVMHCAIGSVKSNIGHLEAAAGIAGVTKILLQMKYRQLVPSIHSEALNPNIDFASTPFVVQRELSAWQKPQVNIDGKAQEYPRLAGMSCFGAGGSNAHIILEEYESSRESITTGAPALILLSAKTPEQLSAIAKNLLAHVEARALGDEDLLNLCYTLQVGREAMDVRAATIVDSMNSLKTKLKQWEHEAEHSDTMDWVMGSIKQNKDALSTFVGEEEFNETVEKWLTRKKFQKLLEVWVKGIAFDWKRIYEPNNTPRRISLPTYPFSQEKYWIGSEEHKNIVGHETHYADKNIPVTNATRVEWQFSLPQDSEKGTGIALGANEKVRLFIRQLVADQLDQAIDEINVLSGFYEQGVTSSDIVSMTREIKQKISPDFSPQLFFEYASTDALAIYLVEHFADAIDALVMNKRVIRACADIQQKAISIANLPAAPITAASSDETLTRLEQHARESVALNEIKNLIWMLQTNTQEKMGLSESQLGLWVLQKAFPAMSAYNIPVCFRAGNLDIANFKRACECLVKQQSLLRVVFDDDDGKPYQRIKDDYQLFFDHDYLEKINPEHVLEILQEKVRLPFQLDENVLRVHLVTVSAQETLVLLVVHHIIFDGMSVQVLLRNLFDAYDALQSGQAPLLPTPPKTFFDFVKQEKSMLMGDEGASRLAYWRKSLAGTLPVLKLPTDRPRNKTHDQFAGKVVSNTLSMPALNEQLQKISVERGIYTSTVFLGVFKALLHKYTGDTDLIVGVPVNQRASEGLDDVLGYLINMIPIRSELSSDSNLFTVLTKLQGTMINSMVNSYPLSTLVRELGVAGSGDGAPVFQVAFVYQDFLNDIVAENLPIEFVEGIHQEGEFELVLEILEGRDEFFINWKYNPELFDESTIVRMSHHFNSLLDQLTRSPQERIGNCLLSDEKESRAISDWSKALTNYSNDKCLHELFEQQAGKWPDNIAVALGDETLSYKQLNEKANQLAHFLVDQGVKAETLVGLCTGRSLETMIGILGILKAGGAYVPLDFGYPRERIAHIVENSGVQLIVAHPDFVDYLSICHGAILPLHLNNEGEHSHLSIARCSTKNISKKDIAHAPGNAAYVIYTSGSTGLPKGVVIEHQNVTRLFSATQQYFHFTHTDVWTLFHSFAFDFSVWEMWGALLYGGKIIVVPQRAVQDSAAFYKLLVDEHVTVLNQTPSSFRQLISIDGQERARLSLRTIIFGGEALDPSMLNAWVDLHSEDLVELVNMYGITETTVHVTYQLLKRQGEAFSRQSIIGKKLTDLAAYVVDHNLACVPVGVIGQLCVGGCGVARGYLNNEKLTNERFVASPFNNNERLYLTGDLVRWLPDGNLEFIGRIDDQVKIRGFRIELREIEAQLASHDNVKEVVVVVLDSEAGDKQLVAYVTLKNEWANADAMRAYLENKLPEYMVPSAFVILDSMPLTANRKIDKKSLPNPDSSAYARGMYEAPQGKIEQALAKAWEDVLGQSRISRYDNFFKLGGHSLLVVTVLQKMKKEGFKVDSRAMFIASNLIDVSATITEDVEIIDIPQNLIFDPVNDALRTDMVELKI
jgi:amino acid adenylation domain-containing protein